MDCCPRTAGDRHGADAGGGPRSGGRRRTGARARAASAAWLAFPGGVFSVDTRTRTVRYRACDGDTGRASDPDMRITGRAARGTLVVDGTPYAYDVPLVGRR